MLRRILNKQDIYEGEDWINLALDTVKELRGSVKGGEFLDQLNVVLTRARPHVISEVYVWAYLSKASTVFVLCSCINCSDHRALNGRTFVNYELKVW
jgi:hypothetical protein